MATTTTPFTNALVSTGFTTTTFRQFLSDLYTHLSASGLTQRTDTGQADPLTATFATNTNFVSVWDLDDDYSTTAPVVLRFTVRSGVSSGVNYTTIFVQVGDDTDGASVLVGAATGFSEAVDVSTAHPGASSNLNPNLSPLSFNHNASNVGGTFASCYDTVNGLFTLGIEFTSIYSATVHPGGLFMLWRRIGKQDLGHLFALGTRLDTSTATGFYNCRLTATMNSIKQPHLPASGIVWVNHASGGQYLAGPFRVPYGLLPSEVGEVNYYPFEVQIPDNAGASFGWDYPIAVVHNADFAPGDTFVEDFDGNGDRNYKVLPLRYGAVTSSVLSPFYIAIIWD